jgi:hypothetical protein
MRNITASTTPREDVSILKKGSIELEKTIQSIDPTKVKGLQILLKRVKRQIDIYKMIHKIGGFIRKKSRKPRKKKRYASLKL